MARSTRKNTSKLSGTGGVYGFFTSSLKVLYLFAVPLKSNFILFLLFLGIVCGTIFFNFHTITTANIPPFLVQKVEFDGNERVPDVLLLKASGIRYRRNIMSVSIREIKKRLENMSWVRSAVVSRKFPDTISVRIAERIPIAILQSRYKLYLVDADGVVLKNDGIGNFNNLPIVVGDGAEKEVSYLLRCLAQYPKIEKQLVFAIRISKRRWNMRINRGITVKLPEKRILHAIGILSELSDSDGFFNPDIKSIDLRMLDRVVVTRKNTGPDDIGKLQ
ncbi:MAG: FtsQ-type POTRA domain-containing protein [Holosporaceae bacterium]|jgi:cell division septal protein FtsQ|nr:FtsQ-type POTRA domain-containing protein [Holosporaceae bacterium]